MSKADDNRDAIRRMGEQFAATANPFGDLEKLFDAMAPIKTCRACQAKNRITPGRHNPRCGKCGLPL